MKNLLKTLILVLSLTLFNSCKSVAPVSDSRLIDVVRVWEQDVKDNDIKLKKAYEGVVDIRVINGYVMKGILGFYEPRTKTVYISGAILNEPTLLKTIIYHELGHSVGMEHTCYNCRYIMSQYMNTENIKKFHSQKDFWDKELKIYFKYMKEVLDKS